MSKLTIGEKTRIVESMAELEKLHDRLEREAELNKAVSEAKEEGLQQGIEKELINNIKTMYSNGFNPEIISKALSLDIDFVKGVLNK